MPLGETNSHNRSETQFHSVDVKSNICKQYDLIETLERTSGPSKYMRVVGTRTRVGFISPISDNFCDLCNRVRVTADGRLLLCLGNENSVDLRSVVRNHPGDQSILRDTIKEAIKYKPERHYFDPNRTDILRFMNLTGG